MKVAALFAGIGGFELGLASSGHATLMFCEIDPGAREVLRSRFPEVPVHRDVRHLESLPEDTELVTAGFPCQDLSQAGSARGILGPKSGVVSHLLRLLASQDVPHVLIENVPFMLQLNKGRAMSFLIDFLEELGYRWAYRVVDARCFGIPQRRQRVFLLASKEFEPWRVLLRPNRQPLEQAYSREVACGFYWTEGNTGLGWAVDALPTLKGGSAVGIPSPPAMWMPDGRIVTPDIRDAERLQGFRADWTKPAEKVTRRSHRWRLVGNAVCVRAAGWAGRCIQRMPNAQPVRLNASELDEETAWPPAAFGEKGRRRAAAGVTAWPCARRSPSLSEFLRHETKDLSLRAVSGFMDRLVASSLGYPSEFLGDLKGHKARMAGHSKEWASSARQQEAAGHQSHQPR